jgi:hypothetical protein
VAAWLASVDRRVSPRQLPFADADSPNVGAAGELLFRAVEGNFSFLYRVREDGTGRRKALLDPIDYLHSVSPDGQWVIVEREMGNIESREVVAYSLAGGPPIRICEDCNVQWAPDGRWLHFNFYSFRDGRQPSGWFAVPVPPGKLLPALPPAGIRSEAELRARPDVRAVGVGGGGMGLFAPGSDPSIYAFTNDTSQRNLYRIPVP